MRLFPVLFAILLLGILSPVHAHQVSLTYAEMVPQGNVVYAELSVPTAELEEALTYYVSPTAPDELKEGFETFLRENFRVETNSQTCSQTIQGTSVFQDTELNEEMLRIQLTFICGETIQQLTLHNTLFTLYFPDQQNIVHFSLPGGEETIVFTASQTEQTIHVNQSAQNGLIQTIQTFVIMGIMHIFGGLDHILFLLGTIIIGKNIRSLLKIVTGFTIGHSITLILSALGILTLPPALTETMIAVTIVFIGLENIFWNTHTTQERRPALTFVFGLIHGLGFAGALNAIHIDPSQLIPALFSFNAGVEIGQLVLLAIALPALWWMNKQPWKGKAIVGVSALVSVTGILWLIERAAELIR